MPLPRITATSNAFAIRSFLLVPVSVAVVVGRERALRVDAEVGGLLFGEFGQVYAEGGQVQSGDLLVQVFGQDVHDPLVLVGLGEEFDLGDGLVGEAVGHDE